MDTHSRHIAIRAQRDTHCGDCALNPVCLPPAVDDGDLDQLDGIIERNRPLPRGGLLFHEGSKFEAVYAVRAGAIKTCVTTPSGDEQVTGFYLPGEIVGLDSIGNPTGNYSSTAMALETTAVRHSFFGSGRLGQKVAEPATPFVPAVQLGNPHRPPDHAAGRQTAG